MVVSQVKQHRQKVENGGQGIFLFGNPAGGSDADRVNGEQRAGQPRAGNLQPRQQPPDQHGVESVQQHVDDMVAGGMIAPGQPLQPKRDVGEGKIRPEPEGAEAELAGHERVFADEEGIVPDEGTTQEGAVRGQGQQKEAET